MGATALTKLIRPLLLLAATVAAHPALALTIMPDFDSSITGAANAAQVEGAINSAIRTVDSLYRNPGSVGIVFTQAAGNFLGTSETADYSTSYGAYTGALTAVSHDEPSNTILATAIGNLSGGNKTGAGGSVLLTSADGRVALGQSGFSGCFNSGGAFVNSCGQAFDGVITLSTSFTFNFGNTPVAAEFSAIDTVEHEVNKILGGGGQGTVLNAVKTCANTPAAPVTATSQDCAANSGYANDLGVLDLYRYAAPGTPSFTTSGSASSYLSMDGGVTDIIGFNQDGSGDYGDYSTNNNVQSAFGNPDVVARYDTTSPEYIMLEAIGYNGVPEPGSVAVFVSGLVGLRWVRRRRK
jgi:hypothetical protein